jgi:hypothetical protein
MEHTDTTQGRSSNKYGRAGSTNPQKAMSLTHMRELQLFDLPHFSSLFLLLPGLQTKSK